MGGGSRLALLVSGRSVKPCGAVGGVLARWRPALMPRPFPVTLRILCSRLRCAGGCGILEECGVGGGERMQSQSARRVLRGGVAWLQGERSVSGPNPRLRVL